MRFTHALLVVALVSFMGCGDDSSPTDSGTTDSAVIDSAVADSGSTDSAVIDSSVADSGSTDSAVVDSAVADSGSDAGPACGGHVRGTCGASGVSCECCAAGGPAENCLCTTTCTSDADCTDSTRPHCEQPSAGAAGFCTDAATFSCCWFCD